MTLTPNLTLNSLNVSSLLLDRLHGTRNGCQMCLKTHMKLLVLSSRPQLCGQCLFFVVMWNIGSDQGATVWLAGGLS